jgi:hypothetical protein
MAARSKRASTRTSALLRLHDLFPSVPLDQKAAFEATLAQVIETLAPRNDLEDAWALDIAYYTFELQRVEREIGKLLTPEPDVANASALKTDLVEFGAIMVAGSYQALKALPTAEQRELLSLVRQRQALKEEHHERGAPKKVQPPVVSSDAHARMLTRNAVLIDQLTREMELYSRRRTASLRELERYRAALRSVPPAGH